MHIFLDGVVAKTHSNLLATLSDFGLELFDFSKVTVYTTQYDRE